MNSELIRAVLDCGIDDLNILDGAECNFFKILDSIRFEGKDVTMENIIEEVFEEGRRICRDSVREWIESKKSAEVVSVEDHLNLRLVEELGVDPESDITWYINMLNTNLYCDGSKQTVYEKIFPEQINGLQDFTGFDIEYTCGNGDTFEEQKVSILREMWEELADIPVNDDGVIEEGYYDFLPGTDREEIWLWFDEQYPKGVAYLVNGRKSSKTVCKRCGTEVQTEEDEELRKEYPYYCPKCDENMYSFECEEVEKE